MGRGGGSRSRSSGGFGGRSRSPAPPPRQAPTASRPMPAQTQPQTQSRGGGMFSGIGSTIMTGMAFGAGSEVAHQAVRGVMGGSSHGQEAQQQSQVQPQQYQQQQQYQNPCQLEMDNFSRCLTTNDNIQYCQNFSDMLKNCKQTNGLLWLPQIQITLDISRNKYQIVSRVMLFDGLKFLDDVQTLLDGLLDSVLQISRRPPKLTIVLDVVVGSSHWLRCEITHFDVLDLFLWRLGLFVKTCLVLTRLLWRAWLLIVLLAVDGSSWKDLLGRHRLVTILRKLFLCVDLTWRDVLNRLREVRGFSFGRRSSLDWRLLFLFIVQNIHKFLKNLLIFRVDAHINLLIILLQRFFLLLDSEIKANVLFIILLPVGGRGNCGFPLGSLCDLDFLSRLLSLSVNVLTFVENVGLEQVSDVPDICRF